MVLSAALVPASRVLATNGTWTNLAGGTWGTSGNWASGVIADGAGATADFSTLNITAATTVTLDTSRSIGTLKFQDATSANNNWTLAASGSVLTLDNASGQPVIDVLNQTLVISAPLAGTAGFKKIDAGALTLSNANTGLSGPVLINRGDVTVQANNSLGSGTITFDGSGGAVSTRLFPTSGVTVSNPIVINYGNVGAGNNGVIITNGAFDATISGPVTINALATSGGHFDGSTGTNYLNFTGPITDTLPANFVSGGTGNGIVVRSGNIRLSGGGSYFRLDERAGTLQLGANNGVATNAILNLGGNGNSTFDLAGFNQALVGVTNLIGSNANVITNSSTTAASTLTMAPNPAGYSIASFATIAYAGTITDASASAPLNLTISGDATGSVTLSGNASSYRGATTITSGTLNVSSLANGGANSSIGAATNDPGNLVLNGGSLVYTGGSAGTDRGFTLGAGTTSTLGVSSSAATLTVSGNAPATTGALVKSGAGTLRLAGTYAHTGNTTISGGTLAVNGALSGGGNVVVSGGTLAGTGTIAGAVTVSSGGAVAPGDAGVGTLTVGSLAFATGGAANLEFGAGNDQVTVTNNAGLSLGSGNINLYQAGTTTAFSANGTYTLFNVTGGISGTVDNVNIANPVAGKFYNLMASSSAVTLSIGDAITRSWSDSSGDDLWTNASNWVGGQVPGGVGQTARFSTDLANGFGRIDMDGNKTVSGLVFDSTFANYDLAGSGTLTLDNGVAAGAISVLNGQHVVEVPVALAGPTSISTVHASDALTLGAPISGAFAVAITGPGTVTLNAGNSFTTLSVAGGTLNVGDGSSSGTVGTGAVSLSGNATVNFNSAGNVAIGGNISGAGSLSQQGTGTVAVTGSVGGIASLNVSAGAVTVSGSVSQSGGVSVSGSGSLSIGGGLLGAGGLSVSTSGKVSLAGASTFSGGIVVNSGTLALASSTPLAASSTIAVNGGTFDLHGNSISVANVLDSSTGGAITNNAPGTTSTYTFGGFQANYTVNASLNDGAGVVALSDSIANTVSGSAYQLRLNGSSTYSGGTTVLLQSIEAGANSAFGTGPLTLVANLSSVNTTPHVAVIGGITLPNAFVIQQPNAGTGVGALQYDTATTGSTTILGAVTVLADPLTGGTVTGPAAAADFLNLNGGVNMGGTATTFTIRGGNVGIAGGGNATHIDVTGVLRANATDGIPTGSTVNIGISSINGNASLDLNGFNQTLAGLTSQPVTSALVSLTNTASGSPTLTVNNGVANAYGGNITGNLNLAKTNAGNLTLSGATLAFTGNTTVTGGSLTVQSPIRNPGGKLSVAGPGTAALNAGSIAGTNVVSGEFSAISVSAAGSVSVAASNRPTVAQTVLITSGVSVAGGASLDLANNDMLVHNGDAAAIGTLVSAWYSGGLLAGAGLKSSSATAGNYTSLGVALNVDGQGGALYPVFDGQAAAATDVLVKYTYVGDTDLSGAVDATDLANLLAGMSGHLTGWINGDLNYDGHVDSVDYGLLLGGLANQGASLGGPSGASGAVPEPSNLAWLALAMPALSRRRRL